MPQKLSFSFPSIEIKQGNPVSLFYLIGFEIIIGVIVGLIIRKITRDKDGTKPVQTVPFYPLLDESFSRNALTEYYTDLFRQLNFPLPSLQRLYRG